MNERNDVGIIKGMNQGSALLLLQFHSLVIGFVIAAAMQDNSSP